MNNYVDDTGRSYHLVFSPSRIDPKTGKIIWARTYGKKVWPMRIYDDKPKPKPTTKSKP